ncbi:MAG: hypothetical protein AAF602_30740 [Myxococcota bacterium]
MRFAPLLIVACAVPRDPIASQTVITPEPTPLPDITIELDLDVLELEAGSGLAVPVRVVRPDDQPVTVTLTNLPRAIPPLRLELDAGEPVGVLVIEPSPEARGGRATLARLAAETPGGSVASQYLPTLIFDEGGLGPFDNGRGARLSLGSEPHRTFEIAVDDNGGFVVIGTVGDRGMAARFLASGFPDVRFGRDGVVALQGIPRHMVTRPGSGPLLLIADAEGRRLEALGREGQLDTALFDDGRQPLVAGEAVELLWTEQGAVVVDATAARRFSPEGTETIDIDLSGPFDGPVMSAATDANGGLLVGGRGTDLAPRMVRWSLGTGDRDMLFDEEWQFTLPPGLGDPAEVHAIATGDAASLALVRDETRSHLLRFSRVGTIQRTLGTNGRVELTWGDGVAVIAPFTAEGAVLVDGSRAGASQWRWVDDAGLGYGEPLEERPIDFAYDPLTERIVVLVDDVSAFALQ